MKIIINTCFGGFSLSDDAFTWLSRNKNWTITKYSKDGFDYLDKSAKICLTESDVLDRKYVSVLDDDDLRINPDVIECVEKIKKYADSRFSELKIIEIPDDVKWKINEYDGLESIHEIHREWN